MRVYSFVIFLLILILVSCSTDTTPVYQLSTSVEPQEAGSVTPNQGEYDEREEVKIAATPNEHWLFSGWQGDLSGNENPTQVIMNSDKKITALFTKRDYPLTVNTIGEGEVHEQVIQQKTTDYTHGSAVQLTAEPATGWEFSYWENDLEGNENPVVITIEDETTVTAVFEKIDYPLTITIEGEGTVKQEAVQAKTTDYPFGTVVELTAIPAENWTFLQWSGDLEGEDNPKTIALVEPKEVKATFHRAEYPLNITVEGQGKVEELLLTGTKTEYGYIAESEVELTPIPIYGWSFVEWSGDLSGNNIPEVVSMTNEKNITVTFKKTVFQGENGITIECPYAKLGETGIVSGIEYEVVDRNLLLQRRDEQADLNKVCTSLVTDMSELFYGIQFNQNISTWDVSSVKNMSRMFAGVRILNVNRPNIFNGSISEWDVSSVENMESMFRMSNFDQDISSWDVSSVKNMAFMFRGGIDSYGVTGPGGGAFNQDISTWNVSSVENMNGMFSFRGYNKPLNKWDVSSVKNMSMMFRGNFSFNQDLNSWNVSSVENMNGMFLDAVNFNGRIGNWNVSNVTDMGGMFGIFPADMEMFGAGAFNQDISNWDVSSVENMGGMFARAVKFNQDISNWNTSNVTNMASMFIRAISFNQNIGNWDTSKVTSMQNMFYGAVSFNGDIGNWNVSEVTNMSSMFFNPISEPQLTMEFNQDIGNWDVLNVTNMEAMFYRAQNFNHDIGDWNTENVTNMTLMFRSASSFNQDIGGWNVSSVKNMKEMFHFASAFDQNLGEWNISNIDPISTVQFPEIWSLNSIFRESGMSTENYTDTIVGWANYVANNSNSPKNIDMRSQSGMTYDSSRDGGDVFSNAGDARVYLTSDSEGNPYWRISGDTLINN